MMAPCVAELVRTTSSGGEGASQKQPQAKQEDAKQQCEDRHDRHVGRQCRDAGVAADPQQVHEGGLWSRQLHVSRVSPFACIPRPPVLLVELARRPRGYSRNSRLNFTTIARLRSATAFARGSES